MTVDEVVVAVRAGVCIDVALAGGTSAAADVEVADEEAADEVTGCVAGTRPALSRFCKYWIRDSV